MKIILKATTKGQITIPAIWRKRFNTNSFLVETKSTHLEIKPINLNKISENDEYTVFDAIRDNKGRGIRAKDLLKTLKNTL